MNKDSYNNYKYQQKQQQHQYWGKLTKKQQKEQDQMLSMILGSAARWDLVYESDEEIAEKERAKKAAERTNKIDKLLDS